MINRIVLIVLDGLGVGALPDAAAYGDAGCNTLAHLAEASGGLTLPNLEMLGLGHIGRFKGVRAMEQPIGCFGKMRIVSPGKDSLVGHWELAGLSVETFVSVVANEFPKRLLETFHTAGGRKTLGNRLATGIALIEEHGAEHLNTGAPIVWVDPTGTFHVAAHESTIRPEELYKLCREARRLLKATDVRTRVVARPFIGEAGGFTQTERRRDFAGEPSGQTLLDALNRAGQLVMGIGKVSDLFGGRGVTKSTLAGSLKTVLDETEKILSMVPRGLIWVTSEMMGDDPARAVNALQEFDRRLPYLQDKFRPGDLLCLTADHGHDPSRLRPTHSREYVPILTSGPKLAHGVNLGTRATAADLGQTIAEALKADRLPFGDSFLDALRPG